MYKLYSIPGTCSTGITALLTKLGVDFEVIHRDDVPNYTEIVPTNQVPALEDSGQIITEGAAIVLYLLEKHNSDMLPSDISAKGEFLKWLMFDYATLHPAYSKLFAINGTMGGGAAKDKLMQQMADKASATWKIIDTRLADQKFIMGDTPTIVDYLATIYTSWGNYFPDAKITLGRNVERLVNDVSALPEFQTAYEVESIEFKAAA